MTTYAQTTIHSKVAKQFVNQCINRLSNNPNQNQNNSADANKSIGKVVKGPPLAQSNSNSQQGKATEGRFPSSSVSSSGVKNANERDRQIHKELQVLPKSKANINRKMRNRAIPSLRRGDEIILMESSVFPPIYFKKTSMRNVLKQFKFPQNVKALPPKDDRSQLIFQIVSNLFNEITFYVFNILIGENLITQSYYIFFSDSETIPFTKCCNAPVYVELMNNGSGKVLCNSASCPHSNLAEFLINFEDGKKLWTNITYFTQASSKDKVLRHKISRLISNGKYKRVSLVDTVQDTSKQIVDLFYKSKENKQEKQRQRERQRNNYYSSENESYDDNENYDNYDYKRNNDTNQQQADPQFEDTPFLTAGKQYQQHENQEEYQLPTQTQTAIKQQQNKYYSHKPMTAEQLLDTEDSDVDILKMKIHYLTRNQKDIPKRISRDLVRNGKVFQSDFDMIRKIDDIMLRKKNTRTTRISFPKIMEQYRITKYRESKSKSMHKSAKDNLRNLNNQTFA